MDAGKVLDVAVNAYWQADPADVSVNAVCQLAGVSKPSLYREFGSEDGLMRAALDRYAEQVLSDVVAILAKAKDLKEALDGLTGFALDDPRMETGCLFYKMRAGKHRLGPDTRGRINEIEAEAHKAFQEFFQTHLDVGGRSGNLSPEASAQYLAAQLELAITQRAAGEDPDRIRATLDMALSVFARP